MATKEAHCLGDLLLRYSYGELPADIDAVISNHEDFRSLTEAFDILFHYVSHKELERRAHEEQIQQVIDQYNPGYIVLAKAVKLVLEERIFIHNNRTIVFE